MSHTVDNNLGQQDGCSLTQPRVFKFHHISKDNFSGPRRTKKDVSVKRRLQTNCAGESRKLKAQIILNKYIPIKQKTVSRSEETKTFIEDVSCDIKNQEKSGPAQLSSGRKTSNDADLEDSQESCQEKSSENSEKTGLRLVNIANLLKEPDKNDSSGPEEQHLCFSDLLSLQEAPLDLSRKSPIASEDSSPLDLSRTSLNFSESEQGNTTELPMKTLPQPLPMTPVISQSQSKPLQFVFLDNKNILKVVPQPVVQPKIATPLPKITPKLLLPLHQVKTAPQREQNVVRVSESPSSLPPEVTKQIPIQMLFCNGNLIQVLPGKHQNLEPINKTATVSSNSNQTKVGSMPSNSRNAGTEVLLSKKDFESRLVPKSNVKKVKEDGRKSSESMIKTNEKITKNGDLFCTFKNVKHMKFLKEQQAKKYRLKREKNK